MSFRISSIGAVRSFCRLCTQPLCTQHRHRPYQLHHCHRSITRPKPNNRPKGPIPFFHTNLFLPINFQRILRSTPKPTFHLWKLPTTPPTSNLHPLSNLIPILRNLHVNRRPRLRYLPTLHLFPRLIMQPNRMSCLLPNRPLIILLPRTPITTTPTLRKWDAITIICSSLLHRRNLRLLFRLCLSNPFQRSPRPKHFRLPFRLRHPTLLIRLRIQHLRNEALQRHRKLTRGTQHPNRHLPNNSSTKRTNHMLQHRTLPKL